METEASIANLRPCKVVLNKSDAVPTKSKPNDKSAKDLKLKIKLKRKIFEVVEHRDSRNKIAKTVKLGWSSELNKLIWDHFRLKCVWTFKRARPRKEDILFTGDCKDCLAKFDANFNLEKKVLFVTVKGYKSAVKHTSKRRLLPSETREISEMLKGTSAFDVRCKLADELMSKDDTEPPHLVRSNAIKKIKYKQTKSLHKDPVRALLVMKDKNFRNEVTHIGLSPFYVFYGKQLQRMWHNSEFKRKKFIISIDATGLGLRKLGQVEEKYMFLYVICSHGKCPFIYFKKFKIFRFLGPGRICLSRPGQFRSQTGPKLVPSARAIISRQIN
jgi:hypothetical protein